MKLLEQIYHWRNVLRCQAHDPAFVPLTREEFSVVTSDCRAYGQTERFLSTCEPCTAAVTGQKLFGVNVFESPFAEGMRHRQIDIPVTQISEGHYISNFDEAVSKDFSRNCLHRRLTAYICHDTTLLSLAFEWDSLAKLKRKLRITKWFPVRTRTVTIEGRVLYPYLKVTLPHNKHHVQFKHIK